MCVRGTSSAHVSAFIGWEMQYHKSSGILTLNFKICDNMIISIIQLRIS